MLLYIWHTTDGAADGDDLIFIIFRYIFVISKKIIFYEIYVKNV